MDEPVTDDPKLLDQGNAACFPGGLRINLSSAQPALPMLGFMAYASR